MYWGKKEGFFLLQIFSLTQEKNGPQRSILKRRPQCSKRFTTRY